ncbi:Exocyst complex component EXO70B1 [Spatholobus suberectus]|nr:Exocyst complex component EXO70B1 [Spatholobus suberectus]
MGRIEALRKKNGSVIGTISKHIDRCLKANVVDVSQIDRNNNLVLDALWFDDEDNIVGDLGVTVMLATFGLQVRELNTEDIDKKEKVQCWIKALNVAVRLLFPNERKLCHHVFGNFTSSADSAFAELCTELATAPPRTA